MCSSAWRENWRRWICCVPLSSLGRILNSKWSLLLKFSDNNVLSSCWLQAPITIVVKNQGGKARIWRETCAHSWGSHLTESISENRSMTMVELDSSVIYVVGHSITLGSRSDLLVSLRLEISAPCRGCESIGNLTKVFFLSFFFRAAIVRMLLSPLWPLPSDIRPDRHSTLMTGVLPTRERSWLSTWPESLQRKAWKIAAWRQSSNSPAASSQEILWPVWKKPALRKDRKFASARFMVSKGTERSVCSGTKPWQQTCTNWSLTGSPGPKTQIAWHRSVWKPPRLARGFIGFRHLRGKFKKPSPKTSYSKKKKRKNSVAAEIRGE